MAPGWVIATVPMAFMGWMGTGVLKYRPAKILKSPKATRTPTGSILLMVTYPMRNGMRVPRSPKAPANSCRSYAFPPTRISRPSAPPAPSMLCQA